MLSVPGHSCWPQNQPFDRNLALLISSITSLLGKSTTHKMPQSADLFALRLILAKGTFSPGTWPRYRSQRTLFVSRSAHLRSLVQGESGNDGRDCLITSLRIRGVQTGKPLSTKSSF